MLPMFVQPFLDKGGSQFEQIYISTQRSLLFRMDSIQNRTCTNTFANLHSGTFVTTTYHRQCTCTTNQHYIKYAIE